LFIIIIIVSSICQKDSNFQVLSNVVFRLTKPSCIIKLQLSQLGQVRNTSEAQVCLWFRDAK